MDFVIRIATYSDIALIMEVCSPSRSVRSELEKYRTAYFNDDGMRKAIDTAVPDEVVIAWRGKRLLGYIHFYTDHSEGYETVVLSSGLNDMLCPEEARAIERSLQEATSEL